MEPFNLTLKQATQALHTQVEATPISRAMMSPRLNGFLYAEYLEKSYAIQHAVETQVFHVLDTIICDTGTRLKTPALDKDLAQLGKSHRHGAKLLDTDYSHSPAFNLGLMYVTEGSVLGGQYILKNVRKILGEQAPGAFLNVYGETTGSRWKSFLESLNRYATGASEPERQEIIGGALYGFRRVQAVFELPPHPDPGS